MSVIFTVGHSSHKINHFLKLLQMHSVNCLIDVRSRPYSKYAPQFNMDKIQDILNNNHIHYIFMGKELGAKREDRTLYTSEGYLDFEKVRETSLFISGIDRIKNGLEKGYNIALMCTEKDPIDCHRNILVARELYKHNYSIKNGYPSHRVGLSLSHYD